MKTLLSSTALMFALGAPALTLAQATEPVATPEQRQQQAEDMPGFLAVRGESDLYASDLMGHDVYAHRVRTDMATSTGQATPGADVAQDMATMSRTDLNDMDNIGQINEIVLSSDGAVRALVIGIGGFLGVGVQDVAVTMDQVTFAADAEDRSQTYVIVNAGADLLKGSPAFDRTANMSGSGMGGMDAGAGRTSFTAPQMERDGYERVEVTEVTTDALMGKSVFDTNENDVGNVADLIIDDAGKITNVIIDFGGFLGLGTSHASIGFEELTIMSTEGYEDVRVYVDATKEQIQDLPEYLADK